MASPEPEQSARTNALLRIAKVTTHRKPQKKEKATFALFRDQIERVKLLGIVLGVTQSEVIGRMIDSEAIEREVRETMGGQK